MNESKKKMKERKNERKKLWMNKSKKERKKE